MKKPVSQEDFCLRPAVTPVYARSHTYFTEKTPWLTGLPIRDRVRTRVTNP
jgi:hypothetical protein